MKPLLITTLLAVSAPVASANDIVDFHRKIHRVHQSVARIFDAHRYVHRSAHRAIFHRRHQDHHVYTRRVWVPVRYEVTRRRVFIPGTFRRVWSAAHYETRRDHHGHSYRVLVHRGHWDTIRTNGRYEWRRERVRRGGYYKTIETGHRSERHRDRHQRNRR